MKRKLEATGTESKGSGSSSDRRQYVDQASVIDLRAEMTAVSRGSKASIRRVLSVLNKRGALVDDRLGGKGETNALVRATTKHADAKTPYGTVVQRCKLAGDYI